MYGKPSMVRRRPTAVSENFKFWIPQLDPPLTIVFYRDFNVGQTDDRETHHSLQVIPHAAICSLLLHLNKFAYQSAITLMIDLGTNANFSDVKLHLFEEQKMFLIQYNRPFTDVYCDTNHHQLRHKYSLRIQNRPTSHNIK